MYVDLHLDVVRVGREVRLVDEEKFRVLSEKGVLLRGDALRYECLAAKVASTLRELEVPLEVARFILEAQGECFKNDPLEDLKLAVMERLRGGQWMYSSLHGG